MPQPHVEVDVDALGDLLEQLDGGQAPTRPVSVSLPVPLIDALRMLVDAGVLPSTSAIAAAQLEQVVRNRALRLHLDELYAQHPEVRPEEDSIAVVMERNRLLRGGAA